MLAIATMIQTTQKRKAPAKRACPLSTYQGNTMSAMRRPHNHPHANLLFVIMYGL